MNISSDTSRGEIADLWPALPFEAWRETRETLHMWTQIIGKVRLALSLHLNHWWQVPLYITACGMTAFPIPYHHRLFEVILLVRLLLCVVFVVAGLAKLAGSRQALRDFGRPAAFVC